MQKDAIEHINEKIYELYSIEKIEKHLVFKDNKTGKKVINKNCFDAVICKNGWKNSNNKYHHKNNNPEYHYYSPALVDEFVKKAMTNEDYLMNTKKWYNARRSKQK